MVAQVGEGSSLYRAIPTIDHLLQRDCLLQELLSPRQSTVVAGGGFILLIIFAAFLRGKRSGKFYEDFVEEVEFEEDSEIDFVETEEIVDEEWEEDIELLD